VNIGPLAIRQPELKQTFLCGGIRRYILKESKVKFEWNNWKGFTQVRQSQFMMDELIKRAESMGTVEKSFVGVDRCHVIVEVKK
jgi:hypothetical protein